MAPAAAAPRSSASVTDALRTRNWEIGGRGRLSQRADALGSVAVRQAQIDDDGAGSRRFEDPVERAGAGARFRGRNLRHGQHARNQLPAVGVIVDDERQQRRSRSVARPAAASPRRPPITASGPVWWSRLHDPPPRCVVHRDSTVRAGGARSRLGTEVLHQNRPPAAPRARSHESTEAARGNRVGGNLHYAARRFRSGRKQRCSGRDLRRRRSARRAAAHSLDSFHHVVNPLPTATRQSSADAVTGTTAINTRSPKCGLARIRAASIATFSMCRSNTNHHFEYLDHVIVGPLLVGHVEPDSLKRLTIRRFGAAVDDRYRTLLTAQLPV